MFTGIVTDIGRVAEAVPGSGLRLRIACGYDPATIAVGGSIAHDGVCLTATEVLSDGYWVDVSAETLAKTTLGDWRTGTTVNLERPLRMGDELGGHMVLGHVDGVAEVADHRPDGDSVRFRIVAPQHLARFIAPKGSVALDGVSLTVNEVDGPAFGVNIVPHTLAHTTLSERSPGDRMNLEVDVVARYVARMREIG